MQVAWLLVLSILLGGWPDKATASPPGPVRIAVAANFARPAADVARAYTRASGVPVDVVSGSTGRLVAQITQGAPFDALLAADQAGPDRLIETGHGVAVDRFTYFVGTLAVYRRRDHPATEPPLEQLLSGQFRRLSVANPRLAPYGRAAMQVLESRGLLPAARARLVMGENVAQAFALAASGNADLALVALVQVQSEPDGCYSLVPQRWHQPIAQDAVLLSRSTRPEDTRRFLGYLRSDAARKIMAAWASPPGRCGPAGDPDSVSQD